MLLLAQSSRHSVHFTYSISAFVSPGAVKQVAFARSWVQTVTCAVCGNRRTPITHSKQYVLSFCFYRKLSYTTLMFQQFLHVIVSSGLNVCQPFYQNENILCSSPLLQIFCEVLDHQAAFVPKQKWVFCSLNIFVATTTWFVNPKDDLEALRFRNFINFLLLTNSCFTSMIRGRDNTAIPNLYKISSKFVYV